MALGNLHDCRRRTTARRRGPAQARHMNGQKRSGRPDDVGSAAGTPERWSPPLRGDLGHVLGGWALGSLDDVELDAVALGERLESGALDRGMVDEAVLLLVITGDEAEALRVVEPFHGAGRTHCDTPVMFVLWSECEIRTYRLQRDRDHCPHEGLRARDSRR